MHMIALKAYSTKPWSHRDDIKAHIHAAICKHTSTHTRTSSKHTHAYKHT